MIEETPNRDSVASSIQIGFVINVGIMTTFIAVILVVLSGGIIEDVSTEEELERVADQTAANLIEADKIAQTQDNFIGFFDPPRSDVDYTAEVSGSNVEVWYEDEQVTTPVRVDSDVTGTVEFSQRDETVVLERNETVGGVELDLDVQQGVAREGSDF